MCFFVGMMKNTNTPFLLNMTTRTKHQLPAKYTKMTVCTFWMLKQLKTMNLLTEEQLIDATAKFHLTESAEDQMFFYKDLVENFDEHENHLKMFANAKNIKIEPEVKPVVKKNDNCIEGDFLKQLLNNEQETDDYIKDSPKDCPIQTPKKIKLIIKVKPVIPVIPVIPIL